MGIDPLMDVNVDVDVQGGREGKKSQIERGEGRAKEEWEGDLYGVGGEGLGGKRRRRGWREGIEGGLVDEIVRVLGEGGVGEEVRGLVGWRGGETGREIYGGKVPWGSEEMRRKDSLGGGKSRGT